MADKQKVLLESIEKLRRLNVSDEEIVSYLKEFGIPEDYIQSLLGGSAPNASMDSNEKSSKNPPPMDFDVPVVGDIKTRFFRKKPEDPKATGNPSSKDDSALSKQSKQSRPESKSEPKEPKTASLDSSQELSSLWEKGILNTVTDSLIEMKKIRDDLDNVLAERLDKALEKENKKLEALQDSTRQLIIAKMNAELEKKSKELSGMLDERIGELKRAREELKKEEDLIHTEKKVASELYRQLSDELVKSKDLRDKSLTQFNADLFKSKSDIAIALEDSRRKMLVVEERATKTLQLETAIIGGMVKDAAGRIDRMTIEKIDELSQGMQARLDEFERIKTEFDWVALRNELKSLRERVNDLELKSRK